jgi:hypothetical protein
MRDGWFTKSPEIRQALAPNRQKPRFPLDQRRAWSRHGSCSSLSATERSLRLPHETGSHEMWYRFHWSLVCARYHRTPRPATICMRRG